MKRTAAPLLIAAFTLLFILSALPSGAVAQPNSYSITSVDHQVQVMYSGNVVILDTIHLSSPVSDGFMIGLPLQYSANVLKALAYDDTHVYRVSLGLPLGDRGGFYGAQVNFNGYAPSTFTVAFVLNTGLVTDNSGGNYTLIYPAYPSLTQDIPICSVKVTFPASPSTISISKSDGDTNEASYLTVNLPAYTYSTATAVVRLSTGSIQPTTVSNLNRQITIDPTGAVTSTDTYRLISNSSAPMSSFVVDIPPDASNVVVLDQFGTPLTTYQTTGNNVLHVNTTLSTFVSTGQSTSLNVEYNLPGATLQGDNYVLADFQLFPKFLYVVEHATMVFTPPEGATITTPQVGMLDESSTLTRDTFQDTLVVTEESISYVNYLTTQQNALQLSYSYNPVWVSFRTTFWAASTAAIVCIGAVVYRRFRPKEETYKIRAEKLAGRRVMSSEQNNRPQEIKTGQPITADIISGFLSTYEDKKALRTELKSLDFNAQKGKLPRRQYKVQKQTIEVRLESLNRSLERTKAVFRGSTGTYPDLVRQLDLAEEDLFEAEETIRNLQARQSRGEISLQAYKKNIAEYQKVRDKAETAITGILLRLHEKIR